MSVLGRKIVHFRYMSFSVQWRSFSVHQRFAITISGHDSEEFGYIKMFVSVHIHFGTSS